MKRKTVSGIMLTLLLIGTLILTFNIQQVKAQEEGLIAYFPFNGNANDESGNNHNGTVYGATLATDRFGNPNSAYSFDGIDDYVEVPHDADFDFGTGGFTVSAWIKTNATTTSGSGRDDILSKGDATISGFAISMENNKAAFWVGPSGEFFGSSVLNDGEWHQIVGTRDDSGNVVLYIDGMSESTGINNQDVNTTYSVFIGKHGTMSESYFNGLIDDVRIYNRAVPPHGVFLSPSSQAGYDIPGATVSYTLEVINRMGSNDSFDLSVSGNAWPTNLSTDNTGTIPDGESVSFTAEVEIPALASLWETDTATITATSVSDPAMIDTATVATTASVVVFSDNFDRDTLGDQWISGAERGCTDTIRIVDGRVEATDNWNYIESQESFTGNLIIEVNVEKVGSLDHGCWDFFVELVALGLKGAIRLDTYGIDGINLGGPGEICGDRYSMSSAGPNRGKAILVYKDSYIQFSFINDDGDSLTTEKVYAGTFDSSKIRIWLAAFSDSPRYIDNVTVFGAPAVFLEPSPQAGYDIPGATANYTLKVINRMGMDDSFDLSVSGNAWPTNLSISNTGTIGDGESVSFTTSVAIPSSVSPGDTDTATVTATSTTDPTVTDTAAVTTTATSGEYAYVAVSPYDYVALVDRAINQVVGTINVGASGGHWPWRIAIEPGGQYVYVSCRDSDNIVVIDREGNSIFTVISDPALNRPHGITFTYDGAYALVGSRDASQVAVIDTSTHAVIETIAVSSPPTSIATSPTGTYAYATSRWNDKVFVIAMDSMSVVDTISVGYSPWDVVLSPGGELAYVTNRGSSTVSVIDITAVSVVHTISVGGEPHGLEISPDGSYLYMAGGWSGAVHVIDTTNNTVVADIDVSATDFSHPWDVAATCGGEYIYVTNSKDDYNVGAQQVAVIDAGTHAVVDTISMPDSDGDGYPDWGARGLAICHARAFEHELIVSLEAPDHLEPSDSSLLETTVYNRGLSNETDVELFLLINGTAVNSTTIPKLLTGESYTINYLWTPTVEATYNVTAYAPPVPSENVTTNNLKSRMVYVRYIEVALISDYSELLAITAILDTMGIGYDIYNDNSIYLYTEDLELLLNYEAVIFYTDYRHITSNEYTALESYLSCGGSLLVTGFDSLISDDLLRDIIRSSTMGDNVGEPDLYVVDETHPIMSGPYGSFPAGYHISGLSSDCDAIEADTGRNAITVAELADGYDKIIATDGLAGKVVYWNGVGSNDWIWNVDCEVIFKNTLAWFLIQYEHELTVSLEAPAFLKPNDSSLLNATVYNRGLSNETDIELFLLVNGTEVESVVIPELLTGSSYTLSRLWTPTVEGIYNVTAYAPPVPNENITINNVNSRYVIVEEYFTFHFRACIDGSDWVYIRGNEVWYVHRNYQYPGIHSDCPDNATYINGDPWYPEWPDDYGYDDYGQRSLDTYTNLYPSLFSVISLTVIEARGSISIVQYPSVENDYTTIILLDDDPAGGAAWYEFELRALAHQHELAVTLDAPTFLEPGDSSLLNATVLNGGLSNETNVELQLLINGSIVDSVMIPELQTGSSYTLRYLWTPTMEATYNVTAYASPVIGESFIVNNVASANTVVMYVQYTLTVYSVPTGVTFTVDDVSRTTPWSGTYDEGASVSLVMPEFHDGYVWGYWRWIEDGDISTDSNRTKSVIMDTDITLTGYYSRSGFHPGTGEATKIWLMDTSDPTAVPVTYPDGQQYIELNDTYTVGDTFTVWANATDVNELRMYQVGVTYDPAILECTGYSAGEFFYRADEQYRTGGVNVPWLADGSGILGYWNHIAWVLKRPGNVSGTGTLAWFNFRVVGDGVTLIDIILTGAPLAFLTDVYDNEIDFNTIDIVFDNRGYVPPRPVGGKATLINIPMNEPETPTLWIWLTTIILPLLATVVYVKFKKKKQ